VPSSVLTSSACALLRARLTETSFRSCHRGRDAKVPGLAQSFDEAFEGVLTGKYDYFYTLGGQVAWAATGRYCGKLVAVGNSFFQNSVGYLLPKDSNLTAEFSKATLQLRETDKLQSISEFIHERQKCPPLMNPTLVRSCRAVGCYDVIRGYSRSCY
jgi:hypothetical protein